MPENISAISTVLFEKVSPLLEMPKLRLIPLSPVIAYRSTVLPQTFPGDPADQIIVATAREENATILTKDKNIRQYKYARTLW